MSAFWSSDLSSTRLGINAGNDEVQGERNHTPFFQSVTMRIHQPSDHAETNASPLQSEKSVSDGLESPG